MNAALVIAAKDLRQKLRDRSVLLMAVAGPARARLPLLHDDPRPGHLPHDVRGRRPRRGRDRPRAGRGSAGRASTDADVATLVTTATEAEARAAVDAGDVEAAIVIPAGFTAAVQAGQPAQLLVIGGPSTPGGRDRPQRAGRVRQPGHRRPGRGGHGDGRVRGARPTRRWPASSRLPRWRPRRRSRSPPVRPWTGSPRRRPTTARRWRSCSSSSPPSSGSSGCSPSAATARWRGCWRPRSPRPRSCSAR